jgi:hypothetical protein
MGIPPKDGLPMPDSEEQIKQFFVSAFQLLKDHHEQIGYLRASVGAMETYFSERMQAFQLEQLRGVERFRAQDRDAALRAEQTIQRLQRLVQEI